ncbi:ABC transporter ATP-binding protein [Desulfogranum japonicum]|uniref:ABC transporter ATP-binding protein n=1 Tax=Desulfogranum japonicum TaxID=231447 RepID=UPI00040872B7|nr:ABC transporter ATP-binding protein [Desulfogranum japonicum]
MQAIQFQSVSKSFRSNLKKIPVLHELTLEIMPGEIFGFIGPNGAGKSTSIKMLLNFLRPDSGKLYILGQEIGKVQTQQSIGYLPESPCFYENLTGREIVTFAGKASGLSVNAVAKKVNAILQKVNLANAADKKVKKFSKGMKQRLGLASALIHDPQIFIFDEPMSGLDPMGRHLVAEIIKELKAQNKTVFFCTHILNDVEAICDRIGILHQGRLLFCGPIHDFTKEDQLEKAFINLVQRH